MSENLALKSQGTSVKFQEKKKISTSLSLNKYINELCLFLLYLYQSKKRILKVAKLHSLF